MWNFYWLTTTGSAATYAQGRIIIKNFQIFESNGYWTANWIRMDSSIIWLSKDDIVKFGWYGYSTMNVNNAEIVVHKYPSIYL
jgi:hypothetical protein